MKKHIPRLLPVLACLALLTAALLPPQISRLRDQALSGAVHAEGWNSSLEPDDLWSLTGSACGGETSSDAGQTMSF